jgi:hypothetical protein
MREAQKARETPNVRLLVVEDDSGADLRSRVQIVIQSDPTHTFRSLILHSPHFPRYLAPFHALSTPRDSEFVIHISTHIPSVHFSFLSP